MSIEELLYNEEIRAYLLSLPDEEFEKECKKLYDALETAETSDLPDAQKQALRFFEELKKERESSKKNSSPGKQSIEPDGLDL